MARWEIMEEGRGNNCKNEHTQTKKEIDLKKSIYYNSKEEQNRQARLVLALPSCKPGITSTMLP
jgi:hypothetical protein